MAFNFDVRNDRLFRLGYKSGLEKSRQSAIDSINYSAVWYFMDDNKITCEEVADIVGVPIEFVQQVKDDMLKTKLAVNKKTNKRR